MTDQLVSVSGPPAFEPEHPGAILREEFLEPARVGVKEAAEQLGVTRQTLHRVLAGDSAVSAEMAVRLSRFTDTSPGFWLNLQAQHDLWHLARTMKAELSRIGSVRAIGPVRSSREIAGARKRSTAAPAHRATVIPHSNPRAEARRVARARRRVK